MFAAEGSEAYGVGDVRGLNFMPFVAERVVVSMYRGFGVSIVLAKVEDDVTQRNARAYYWVGGRYLGYLFPFDAVLLVSECKRN